MDEQHSSSGDRPIHPTTAPPGAWSATGAAGCDLRVTAPRGPVMPTAPVVCDREDMDWYLREQRALVRTLRQVGPDAPTLCEGWRSRHLAAHLYLRLHRPWHMAPGAAVVGYDADEVTVRMGDRAAGPEEYLRLLEAFQAPPARSHPVGWGGDRMPLRESGEVGRA